MALALAALDVKGRRRVNRTAYASVFGIRFWQHTVDQTMFRQFLVGFAVSVGNIAIHAILTAAIVRVAKITTLKQRLRRTPHLIAVMIATVSVLMAAHACEVMVWALAYAVIDAAPAGADLVYFAFVNYTTLGYGDVLPSKRWLLLGPMTAMNGVLLFGWSTALIFEVLRKTIARLPGYADN